VHSVARGRRGHALWRTEDRRPLLILCEALLCVRVMPPVPHLSPTRWRRIDDDEGFAGLSAQ
jgi:hypothetical protein